MHASPQPAGTIGRSIVTTLIDTFNCKYVLKGVFLPGSKDQLKGVLYTYSRYWWDLLVGFADKADNGGILH